MVAHPGDISYDEYTRPYDMPGYYYERLFKLLEKSKAADLKLMLNNLDTIKEEMERQLLLKS